MKHLFQIHTYALLLAAFLAFPTAYAQPTSEMKGQDMKMGGRGMQHGKDSVYKAHHRHSWKSSLTSEQSSKVWALKLEYMKKKFPLTAKKKAIKTDLALLVISDKPNTKAIDKKIDELVALKKEMMKLKYRQKTSLRKLLTSEQKVQFDMSMLRKAQRGKKQRSHH